MRFKSGTGWDFLAHLPACPTLLASGDVLPWKVELQSLLLSLLTDLMALINWIGCMIGLNVGMVVKHQKQDSDIVC